MAVSSPYLEKEPRELPGHLLAPESVVEPELDSPDNGQLTSAFSLFNDLSQQLTDSYQLLEDRVTELTQELHQVSEQREQELQEKVVLANQLENLIHILPAGMVILNKNGVITDANPTAEALLEPELIHKVWREVVQRCFTPRDDDGHEVSTVQGQRISIATRSLEENGQLILLTDQTETRQLQAALSRQERLSALGKMVSTLAHQVRTPLSTAVLYGHHLLEDSLNIEQRRQFTQKLMNRLYEMERQVKDMLMFVKGDLSLDDRLNIGDLYQQLLEVTEMAFYHHQVDCRWQVDNAQQIVRCNLDALTGAILNLVNNSLQAMNENGDLEISLDVYENQLRIQVRDNGCGISPENLQQVEELFYTSKSQGTGIGLTVVKTIVRSHAGTFQLTPNSVQGVTATLLLPVLESNNSLVSNSL